MNHQTMQAVKACFPGLVRLALLIIVFPLQRMGVVAQSNLPPLQNWVRPNPAPAAPGDVFTPNMTASLPANAPECAEWTRTAGPDESLVITGSRFSAYTGGQEGKDTRFLVYGRNFSKDARIQKLQGDKAMLTIDAAFPEWSMYLVWPGNENGYGYPVAINKTEAWWIGPDKAARGSLASVYGRNLSHNNDSATSYVYIKPASGAGQFATLTRVNPYRVVFRVPNSLPDGTYEVWAHNGHGGDYGWSGPLQLEVFGGQQWTNTMFDITTYGAVPNDGGDDTGPIKAAIAASAAVPNSTVFFPAGTFLLSDLVSLGNNMRWMGAGNGVSIVKCVRDFAPSASNVVLCTSQNVEISNMTFDGNDINPVNNIDKPFFFRNSTDLRISNVSFAFPTFDVIDVNHAYRVFMTKCSVIGQSSFLGDCSQLFIDSCDFRLTYDSELALFSWGGEGVSLTNSTCKDFDNSDPNDPAGWGKGRFFVGSGVQGSNRSTYLAYNTTTDLTVRPDADQNSGEQFLWEGNETLFSGPVVGVTANTVSFSSLPVLSGKMEAVITKGPGLGQARRITGISGNTITLSEAWNVRPGAGSEISIGPYSDRVVIYKNYLDGKPYAVTNPSHIASTGIEPYGGMFNLVADANTMHQVRYGIATWATHDGVSPEPNFFNLYANNIISEVRWAINMAPIVNNTENDPVILASVFRHNSMDNILIAGITTTVANTQPGINTTSIFEHNTFLGAPTKFETVPDGAESFLFYNNAFESDAPTSSPALEVVPGLTLRENQYQGYSDPYPFATATQEAPFHVIELKSTSKGKIVDSSFIVWNSGVSAFNWTITDDAPWLTLTVPSGSLADETESDTMQLHADPAALLPGTHTATLQVNSGIANRFYTVVFQVAPLSPLPIRLTEFTARRAGTGVLVHWQTASEENTEAFHIEHSENAHDWKDIGQVAAKGPRDYSWTHMNPVTGNNYYRLRSVDFDGKFSLSAVRLVNIEENESGLISCYPNPASRAATLYFPARFTSPRVYVYDASGQLIRSVSCNGLLSNYALDITGLAAGNYFVIVHHQQKVYRTRLQVR